MRTPRPWALPSEPAPLTALTEQGVTRGMIATQLAAGRLIRVRQSVFLGAEHWPADTAEQHLVRARAETVVHPDAAISHASAALVWDLPTPSRARWEDAPITITLPGGGRYRSRPGPITHQLGPLPAGHVTRDPNGYRVTTIARTAIDLVRGLAVPEALVVLDAATRRICTSYVTKPRRADYSNPRHRSRAIEELDVVARTCGVDGLADVLELTEPARESPAESLTAGHIHLAGIPRPLYQAAVRTPAGTLYPDCLWADERLIGECDGAVKYTDEASIVYEKEREQTLRDLGFRMVRWLAKEIMIRPDVVMDRIARELASG
ncbi:DUF559 domain-containing protein [Micropruina sp.]|uniref:DUF559 domain-containing protein n=1 Tax=Micropruina sp. TaxID=2737536 RepID=UPI0039E53BF8